MENSVSLYLTFTRIVFIIMIVCKSVVIHVECICGRGMKEAHVLSVIYFFTRIYLKLTIKKVKSCFYIFICLSDFIDENV